jgi:hypothetical protein
LADPSLSVEVVMVWKKSLKGMLMLSRELMPKLGSGSEPEPEPELEPEADPGPGPEPDPDPAIRTDAGCGDSMPSHTHTHKVFLLSSKTNLSLSIGGHQTHNKQSTICQ